MTRTPPSRDLFTDREILGFRVLGVVAAVVIVAIGMVHRIVNPMVDDPVWERALVATACLAGSFVTFFDRGRLFRVVLYSIVALVTLWVVHLVYLNDFSAEYGFSLLIVVSAASMLFHGPVWLGGYLVGVILAVAAAGWAVAEPLVSPLLYTVDVGAISLLLFLILGSRIRAERDLTESEERLFLAAEGSRDGLWDWDLVNERIHFSDRWKDLLGRSPGEIGDRPSEWFDRVHPEDRPALTREIERLKEGVIEELEHEYRMSHRDGEYRWMLTRGAAVREEQGGGAVRMAGSQTDVTERRRVREQLRKGAFEDPLTELANRALFTDRLDRLFQRASRREGYRFAMLFVDLDRFKRINDSLGHAAGDRILIEVAERVADCIRGEDTLARLGGDEFGILMDGVDGVEDAVRLAERIQEAVAEPLRLDGRELRISVSIGIAVGDSSYGEADDVMRDADIAMYRAKSRTTGTSYEIFDEGMHKEAVQLLNLEHGLRRALDNDEFELYYQPVVDLVSEDVRGFEALIRWRNPDAGLLLPDAFVPRAEETGLIVPLGEWVLREACTTMGRDLERTDDSGRVFLSVNLSAHQFLRPDLLDWVDRVLEESGMRATRLRIELTERVLLGDAPRVQAALNGLRERGVGVSIDDFGTGHSSLSYLHRFPIHSLKIDRSFLEDLGSGRVGRDVLARTVLGLARSLGMDCVAEGIERVEQLQELLEMECPMGQGYLFSRPLEAGAARKLLEERDGGGDAGGWNDGRRLRPVAD